MALCNLCDNEATKEVHYVSPAGTKYYTDLCEVCFPAYKKRLVDSANLVYKGYFRLDNKRIDKSVVSGNF